MRRDDNPAKTERDVTRPRAKPGQAWICGYAELGQCCRSGPTCDGHCGRTVADEEREPGAKHSGSSSLTSSASPTTELPPCIPRRGLAIRRQSLRLNIALLTGGLLMLCMTLPTREKLFVPGELSSKHAQILDNTIASQRCGLCHPQSHSSDSLSPNDQPGRVHANPQAAGLLQSARRLIENDGRQDQLCMRCHERHMPAATNRDPHDLSPAMWREMQRTSSTPWQLVSTLQPVDEAQLESTESSSSSHVAKTSCAMCHNEHHGRGFDIKLISDSRCQACHQRQFESLASGHPEFKDFPIDRPRGIAFSHGQHAQNHFPKKNRDFDCQACHLPATKSGATELVARSLSFEHACASCHDQPIRAATVDGWAALQLPSIEADDAANDADFVKWPMSARYGYDGVVSPVMRALLMADPEAASALEKLPGSGKIVDISTISSVRSRVAKTLALSVKRLIEETARDGQAAWKSRLQRVTETHLGRELNDRDQALIVAMAAGLPPDLFRNVESQWFSSPAALAQRNPQPSARYQGRLINAAPRRGNASVPSEANPQSQADSLLPVASQDGLLLDASQDLLETPKSNDAAPPAADDLLTEPAKATAGDDLLLGATEPEVKQKGTKLVKGATHLMGGGWYADQSTMSIRYMPTGHADATLAAWTLWWSMIESHRSVLPDGDAQRIARQLSLAPGSPDADQGRAMADWVPGNCAQCHELNHANINRALSERPFRLVDYYQVPKRSDAVKEFTKFNHTPHLTLPALSDCRYCHQEKSPQPSVNLSAVKHHPVMSEFASMKLTQCAACHRSGGANASCVQCHNYHVSFK